MTRKSRKEIYTKLLAWDPKTPDVHSHWGVTVYVDEKQHYRGFQRRSNALAFRDFAESLGCPASISERTSATQTGLEDVRTIYTKPDFESGEGQHE
jgi:hypothetical protein